MTTATDAWTEFEELYVESCALDTQTKLHSTYKNWVSEVNSYNAQLEKYKKGFRFRQPSEPVRGFEAILAGYKAGDDTYAKAKFGNVGSKNLE